MFEVTLSAISAFILNHSQGQDRRYSDDFIRDEGEPTEIKAVIEARDSLDGSSGVSAEDKISEKVSKLDIA